MELVGVRCVTETTGGDGVFVPLASVAVLFGQNDSGKTRILRATENLLSEFPSEPGAGTVYLELARWQLGALLERACGTARDEIAPWGLPDRDPARSPEDDWAPGDGQEAESPA